jgi:hypothetical protein
MRDRRFTFPQVHEALPQRRDERPPDGRLSQRDLVALSLLLHPHADRRSAPPVAD